MAVRILWEFEEAAILFDACKRVSEKMIDRTDAIREVSRLLRNRAIRKGIMIDDVYRNENGIGMQMRIMESMLQRKVCGLRSAPKVFVDIAILYNENMEMYNQLLTKAKGECVLQKNVQEDFFAWLADRVSPAQLSEFYMECQSIDRLCLKNGILKKPLFESTDAELIKRICDTVIYKNREFRNKYFYHLDKMHKVLTMYIEFLDQKGITVIGKENDVTSTAVTSFPVENPSVNSIKLATEQCCWCFDDNKNRVDFNDTVPVAVKFRSAVYIHKDWVGAFVRMITCLQNEYPMIIRSLVGFCFTTNNKAVIGTSASKHSLSKPIAINDGLFTETAFVPNECIQIIASLLRRCKADPKILSIYYITKTDISNGRKNTDNSVESIQTPDRRSLENNTSRSAQFEMWLRANHVTENMIKNYSSAIAIAGEYALENHFSNKTLFELESQAELKRICRKISADHDFWLKNMGRHNLFEWGLAKYQEFYKACVENNSALAAEKRNVEEQKDTLPSIKPYVVKVGEKTYAEASYAQLMKSIADDLYERNKERFEELLTIPLYLGKPIVSKRRVFGNSNTQLKNNWYIRTGYSENIYHLMLYQLVKHFGMENSFSITVFGKTIRVFQKKECTDSNQSNIFLTNTASVEQAARSKKADIESKSQRVILSGETEKNSSSVDSTEAFSTPKRELTAEERIRKNRVAFIEWMRMRRINSTSVVLYLSDVKKCSEIARNKGIIDRNLFLIEESREIKRALESLKRDSEFRKINNRFKGSLERAVTSLAECWNSQEKARRADKSKEPVTESEKQYTELLKEYFPDGLRVNRSIDRNRFKGFFAEKYGEELRIEDEQLIQALKAIGTCIDDRVFAKGETAQNDLLARIDDAIVEVLNSGGACVYLESLFVRYQEELAKHLHIYSEEALEKALFSGEKRKYVKRYGHLCMPYCSAQVSDDVVKYMKASMVPVTYQQMREKLWYIPFEKVKQILVGTESIVNVAEETYFYAPNLPISDTEVQKIAELLHRELGQRSYVSHAELMQMIEEQCPSVLLNTSGYNAWGVRNCLAYLLRDRFSFRGAIISANGEEISMSEVFRDYCIQMEHVTVSDLNAFAKELNTTIYWDTVYEEMIRINQNELIRKDQVQFDIERIDAALDLLVQDEYIPMGAMNLYFQLPTLNVKWNKFVLESYISNHSRKFRLIHASYSTTDCFGAIVRRDSGISDYYSLVVDVLSRDKVWSTASDAIQLLVDEGYQQRKIYGNIDKAMLEAKNKRIQST